MTQRRSSGRRDRSIESTAVNRRKFMAASAGLLAGSSTLLNSWKPALAAKKTTDSVYGKITVTEIESHRISLPYQDWIHYQLQHYYGPTERTIYVAHTNVGLVGQATPSTHGF